MAPDSVFPDWLTTFKDSVNFPSGVLVLFPMKHNSRRIERDQAIIEKLRKDFEKVIDLTHFEESNLALEGKGSIVADHLNKKFYIALSSRAHMEVVNELLEQWNALMEAQNPGCDKYQAITFQARD